MSSDSTEQPSPAKVASMAGDQEGQPIPTESTPSMAGVKSSHPKELPSAGSASMAGSKATHFLKSPPTYLVKLFQTQNLQDGVNQILQRHKPCHSNQIFVPHKKSQILGPYFVSHPSALFASIYPQPKEHPLPFQVKPDWSKWVGPFGTWPTWRKSKWVDWINHLEPAFGQIWKDEKRFQHY
ncbi:hypothetical protein SLEP1_g24725 [Rubroshorea leprosula]|uniref:Uncharacterized protein n=1 Tax=Rubroshorea leprosula TaxID=152421 RepID=A0AAV5JMS6_9ROSI|nr:hypothetical protein SLEP1_g24725 [Rubroshorea leprosula]